MRGAVLYGPRDVRFEERPDPTIIQPTDAVIRLSATCVCGSDLWPYRGISRRRADAMGHEYCGIVEEVGGAVQTVKPGQFVIGSFFASDNTCPHCRAGYQTSCQHREFVVRCAGAVAARAARGRHARRDAGAAVRRPDPQPAHAVGCAGHRLVRGRCGEREAGHDGRRRRRWRGRPARRARRPSRWAPSGSSR